MEITDVTTIDQLTDAEVDELLERALNPRTPIEIFYAVLDRIGGSGAAAQAAEGSDQQWIPAQPAMATAPTHALPQNQAPAEAGTVGEF
jgi:hypothetical protein